MSKSEKLFFVFILIVAAGFVGETMLGLYNQSVAGQPQVVDASVTSVIGPRPEFEGNPNAEYTLIEYGDYECPPCRRSYNQIQQIILHSNGQLRFIFRNFPLSSIHAFALPAAIAAEAARQQGKFWPVHDYLYTTPLDENVIDHIPKKMHLLQSQFDRDRGTIARAAVAADISETQSLGINQTPTFFVCCPNGKVKRLVDLDQIFVVLKSKGGA